MKIPMQRMNIEYQGFRKKLQWYWLCARLTTVLVLQANCHRPDDAECPHLSRLFSECLQNKPFLNPLRGGCSFEISVVGYSELSLRK
jgi:hypothetical protein